MIKQWHSFLKSIPSYIADAARALETHPELNHYSNNAIKMMTNAGWKPGAPLKAGGLTEPIPTQTPRTGKQGIGLGPTSSSKKKKARDSYYGFIDESGQTVYGKYNERQGTLTIYNLSTKGRPISTGITRNHSNLTLRKALWWGSGIVGLADATFPHPEGWTVAGLIDTLDRLTVKKNLHLHSDRFAPRTPLAKPTGRKSLALSLGPLSAQNTVTAF